MICQFQRTIKKPIIIEGIGLHSGDNVKIKLFPANKNEGINFIKNNVVIPAKIDYAHSFEYSTTLYKDGVSVRTIEHLMAALYFTGIDNVYIELIGEELPILDGSSKGFVERIKEAGIKTLNEEKLYAVLEEPVKVEIEDKFIMAKPSNEIKITYQANYNNDIIGNKSFTYIPYEKESYEGVYTARTYCFLEEVEYLKKNGLAKGGSLENAVVFHNNQVINEEGLRFEDEPVRHKVLDLIGDLYLLGYPLVAEVYSFKGGHRLNAMFVKTLVENSLFTIKPASEVLNFIPNYKEALVG
ncbi:MAG TPA: UDP-3-O-[3-hydroxymyristoyl] N-acetylglucosamine deacetylase [Sulfurihydrogenibium sp.]|uniref:UDP-3-O-acyl-N-acetylglucosamine deacetylase n=1 Tax=Sulfurihydrogenibium sp. (strain YO3AOP1) TaxID=436114 RepID=UPI0001724DDF|nr:UDP-3-O-acyl-N-acetylglucosamine deacetylase [Sulfurihydrogenibium sp. YO3AOP1]ACD67313.1 UDP-3-0-acyl N-acetylglucosamine deacetylase [Sulfurihydrogenibium sp. YO3AOP1]HBT99279.1 UDP-3-O-[3-hydroxymyristoyl] N-acetylglucosamine deacetylase [Sulfurihydrogenibium sp.]